MLLGRLLVVVALVAVAGCTATQLPTAVIEVDAAAALVDDPVHVRVTGLEARQKVVIELGADDADGTTWRSHGTWTSDAAGVIDVRRDAPSDGTYTGVDPMGLFWSMTPAQGDPTVSTLVPPGGGAPFTVRLTVRSGERLLASKELTRRWKDDRVGMRMLTTAADGVSGVLYTPAATAAARPGVLVFTGSDGTPPVANAALLASRGFPALALDYFGGDGLPETLRDVPIEYFARAARLLQREAGGTRPVAALGYSRGSEAALLLAQHEPDLIGALVVYAPNHEVWPAFPPPGDAWTLRGKPVPSGPIPVDRITAKVLAIAGGLDALWDSDTQASRLATALEGAGVEHQVLRYPDAGHGVGTYPYHAQGVSNAHGGSRAANAAARADGWPKLLEFLGSPRATVR